MARKRPKKSFSKRSKVSGHFSVFLTRGTGICRSLFGLLMVRLVCLIITLYFSVSEVAASSGGIDESSSEIRPHRCPNCNRTYSFSYYLESHLKKCKAKKDTKAASFCEVCGLQFGSRTTLIRHQIEKHGIPPEEGFGSDGAQLPCEYCDRLFDDITSLVRDLTMVLKQRSR